MFKLYEEMNFNHSSDFEGNVDEIAAALNEFKFYNNLKLLVHDGKIFLESDFRPFSSSPSYVILSNGSGDIENALNDFMNYLILSMKMKMFQLVEIILLILSRLLIQLMIFLTKV